MLSCQLRTKWNQNYLAIDWVTANKLAAVRNQGGCASCWDFATAAAVESVIAIKKKTLPIYLSTQQLVDCNKDNDGCNGGFPDYALDYIKATDLVDDTAYPYNRTVNNCTVSTVKNVASKISGYKACSRP